MTEKRVTNIITVTVNKQTTPVQIDDNDTFVIRLVGVDEKSKQRIEISRKGELIDISLFADDDRRFKVNKDQWYDQSGQPYPPKKDVK